MLEIHLLGSYRVRLDGETIDLPSRPAKLLLAYLALSAGTPHPRERIAGLLWPESDEDSARGNLRQALWRLRKAVGAEHLPSDNQVVAFDAGPESRLDTALLQDPADHDLLAAVSAYKGELLPGFYEDWVILERERLQAAFERKIQRLLDALAQRQEWPEVTRWAEHWIAFGQAPEPAYRALMLAHAAQGDLAAVTAAYQRCVSALEHEIGVEPSEETRALYDRLLQGQRPEMADRAGLDRAEEGPGLRHNLPQQSTPFIGRERELAQARQLLSANRLVTVLGPGGMGKTRLALQLAGELVEQFRYGIYFVSLAPIDSAGHIVQTIAEAIGLPLSTGEEPRRQLLRHLRRRQYLLLLDNFEHVLDGAGLVAEILQTAAEVTILCTSRERLGLQEESLLTVDGLAYPGSPDAPNVLEYDAVRLFVDTARRLRPGFAVRADDFPEVARICQMVQGMPLAILLAAAWVDMLAPAEIAGEMSHSLDFLQSEWRGVPERHRSVRAAIETSWRRLAEGQQALLSSLAAFRGGFTLEAARGVTGASLLDLAGLVHKSLLRRDLGTGRYEIHELLRQFAWERLEETPEARRDVALAHAAYFADDMEDRWAQLTGPRQLVALAEIEADLENVRRAWRYWLERRDVRRIGQFLDSFWRLHELGGWYNAGARLFADGAAALHQAFAATDDAEEATLVESTYARALAHQAFCLANLGEVERGLDVAEESAAILRRLDRIAELALPLMYVHWNANYAGRKPVFTELGWRSLELARLQSSPWMQAHTLAWLGREAGRREEHETAERHLRESIRLFEKRGDAISATWPGIELGNVAVARGDLEEARQQYERVLQVCQDTNYQWGKAKLTRYLAISLAMLGQYDDARGYLLQGLKLSDDLGLPRDVVNVLYEMALVEAATGGQATAVWLLALIQNHPLSSQTRTMSTWTEHALLSFRELAGQRLAELKEQMPPEQYAAAVARGQATTLDGVVQELLSDS